MAARHGTISPTLRAGVPFVGGLREGGVAVVVCTHPCGGGGVAGGSSVRRGRENPVASPGPLLGRTSDSPLDSKHLFEHPKWSGITFGKTRF